MGMQDNENVLLDCKTIKETCWSDIAWYVGTPHDAAASGAPKFVHLVAHAPCDLTSHITLQVFGYNKVEDASDAFLLASSPNIEVAKITPDMRISVQVPRTNRLYSYLAAKIVVNSVDAVGDTATSNIYCPQKPLMDETKYPNNTFTIYISGDCPTGNPYTKYYANVDKITA